VTVGTQWSGDGFTADDQSGASPDKTCTPATGSTITPTCSTTGCTPALTGEFSGTVAPCTDYAGFAMLGWNVAATATGTWSIPATGGVTITFTNTNSAATVRFQVQDATGDQWCAPLTSGVEIPWSSLKTKCWGTAGTALTAGTAIQQAMVEVVGNATTAVPYDICVQSVAIQ